MKGCLIVSQVPELKQVFRFLKHSHFLAFENQVFKGSPVAGRQISILPT
jgi:hypothetical protein